MMLVINFYSPRNDLGKLLIEEGVHVVIRDDCRVNLDDEVEELSDIQKIALSFAIDDRVRKALLYINLELIKGREYIQMRCPVCKTDYVVNKSEIEKGYKRFIDRYADQISLVPS